MKIILKIQIYLTNLIHRFKIKSTHFGFKGTNVQIFTGFQFGHSENLFLEDNIVIGTNAFINAHGKVRIKSGTITGPDLMIYSVNHIYQKSLTMPFSDDLEYKEVVIGENCWLGGRVFICPGVELGNGCVVAGGSVITKSFPALSVIGGNPAKVLKTRDEKEYELMTKSGSYCEFINRNKK